MIEQKPDAPDQAALVEKLNANPNYVPWSTQQTFRAVLLTLIPWIIFNLTLNAMAGGSTLKQPLTPAQDLAGAFIAVIFTAIIEAAFLLAPYYYARLVLRGLQARGRLMFQALGLRRFLAGRALLWILSLLVLIFAFDWLYSYVITTFHLNIQTNDQVVLQQSPNQPLTTYGLLAASVFIAPFCEELFFRGLVFPGLLRELSPLWAILISAALFAIAHTDPNSFIPLFAIGCALAVLRWRTGSTWPGIILHMLNNGLSSLLIILAMHHILTPF